MVQGKRTILVCFFQLKPPPFDPITLLVIVFDSERPVLISAVTPSQSLQQVQPVTRRHNTSKAQKTKPVGAVKPVNRQSRQHLTEEEQAKIQELKARDTEVRAHEQAHMAAGGRYITHGPAYSFQKGPDGQRYAVGGEVGIDPSPESGDPDATIKKMQVVRSAALAPATPSAQDRQIAAKASQNMTRARAELSSEKAKDQEANPGQIFDLRA
ncbi:MAG: hypothetical protein GY780_14185 [bacterium]|nr:hypothetical protein [bacterium]